MKRSFAYLSLAALSIVAFISITGFFGDKKTPAVTQSNLWVELEPGQKSALTLSIPSFAPLVQKVEGAVLVVMVESAVKSADSQLPPGLEDDPRFRRFFGNPFENRPPQKMQGQGSGFIIHETGYALTNNHVIENATSIKIKAGNDPKEYDAEVIGADKLTDVALIKIKGDKKNWPVIPLGSSSSVRTGDVTVAIGNPVRLGISVTSGIISGLHRKGLELDGLFDFFQIDAPISPGNSGGPLLNLTGEVIGINTAIINPQMANSIGFSIPIDQVKAILPQLKEKGRASHGWLGVGIASVPEELAKALKLSNRQGALVRQVLPNSPASKAGIEPEDIVTELDGEAILDADELRQKAVLRAGKSVVVKILRNGKQISITVKLEERPSSEDGIAVPPGSDSETVSLDSLGLSVATLGDERKKLDLDKNIQGARVVSVQPSSRAAFAGLEPNDVIFRVNNESINAAKELSKLVGKLEKGSYLRIFFARGKTRAYTDMIIP